MLVPRMPGRGTPKRRWNYHVTDQELRTRMESRAEDKSFKVSNRRVIATSLSRSDKPACGRVGCYTVDYGER